MYAPGYRMVGILLLKGKCMLLDTEWYTIEKGKMYAPGYRLVHYCEREKRMILDTDWYTIVKGKIYVPGYRMVYYC